MKTKWMILPVVALTLGCSREIDTSVTYINGEFTLYATSGEDETRTVLQQDGRVFWNPSDCITVFYGRIPGKFTSTNTEPAASAEFTGSLGSITLDGETEFRAFYPHSDEIVIPGDDGILSIGLPSEQTAVEGTFADDLFICAAKSKDTHLHFYNVCGGVKFSLSRDDIKKVVFRGNNNETLAGRMAVQFDSNGLPQVTATTGGRSSVTLTAPDGGTFKKGSWYYLVLIPQTLSQGYTMELYTDEFAETISSNSSVTLRRSAWGVLKNLGAQSTGLLDGLIVLERDYYVFSDGANSSSTRYCHPEIRLVFDNNQRIWIGYYNTYYWTSYSTGRQGVYMMCGESDDRTKASEEWYLQPRIFGEWVHEKLIISAEGKAQYFSNGELVGEHEFTTLNLRGASNFYFEMDPWGWWYNHYHFMDDFKLTTPYQTITDDFEEGELDLSLWEQPVNPDGVFVEEGVVKTIQKRTDKDFRLISKLISLGPTISVESVSLDKATLNLSIGISSTLLATVLPENATNKSVSWSSSNTSVATVSSNGIVTGVGAGTATITVTTSDGGKTATCTVTVTEPYTVATPEAIDLGLSVKWASFNLGATAPEEYGDYFAWGEIEPYYISQDPLIWKEGKENGYTWVSYKWCSGADFLLTKYCNDSSYGYNGFTDTKTVLDLEDDAAHVNLGGSWRMPTDAEWRELKDNCAWTWFTQDGVNGWLVSASNGNSIFFPAAGLRVSTDLNYVCSRGSYWSSSFYTDYPYYAWDMYMDSTSVGCGFSYMRLLGYPVRPVTE